MSEQVKSTERAIKTSPLLRKSTFISLEFILGIVGLGLALLLTVQQVFAMVMLFTVGNGISFAADVSSTISAPVFIGASSLPQIVSTALFAVVAAALPVFLFPRVKRALRERPDFTQSLAYKLPLFILFGVVVLSALFFASQLVAIAVSSLLLIGVTAINIGDLYTQQFVPALAVLLFLGIISVLMRSLLRAKDTTKLLSWVVLAVTVALALVVIVATTIRVHETNNTYPAPGPINCPTCGGIEPLNQKAE